MKNTPLLSILADSFDRMFVVDKSGKMVFFPWGGKKQGYLIKSKSIVAKAKKFYTSSFLVCFVVLIIAMSIFNSFWGIVGSMLFCFGGWYFVYYVYTSKIVKSLPVAKASYKDIVLEKLEPDEAEEPFQIDIQIPAHWNRPVPQAKSDTFAGIKRIWYRLSPGQLFMASFFIGIFTALIWSSYRPQRLEDTDYLVGFFVCLLWGFSGFVMTRNLQSSQADLPGFIRWKLPMIVIMVGC